jgi:hypothetical protein
VAILTLFIACSFILHGCKNNFYSGKIPKIGYIKRYTPAGSGYPAGIHLPE